MLMQQLLQFQTWAVEDHSLNLNSAMSLLNKLGQLNLSDPHVKNGHSHGRPIWQAWWESPKDDIGLHP